MRVCACACVCVCVCVFVGLAVMLNIHVQSTLPADIVIPQCHCGPVNLEMLQLPSLPAGPLPLVLLGVWSWAQYH